MSTDNTQPRRRRGSRQAGASKGEQSGKRQHAAASVTTPMTLRPRVSTKELAEALAVQLELRRSKLDPDIYEVGALLLGTSLVGHDQHIGTFSRKAAARKLRPYLQPLFELLLQEGEMPPLFSLLLGSASVRAAGSQAEVGTLQSSLLPDQEAAERTYEAFSAQAAQEALQGFPEEL
jgi:hypothetical protein